MKKPVYRIRKNERVVSGLVYLWILLPIWGVVVVWIIRELWRERSRHVVFHTTQAIWLQVGLLVAFILYTLSIWFLRALLEVGSDRVSIKDPIQTIMGLNDWIMLILLALYVIASLTCAWRCLDGKKTLLPLVGKRIFDQEYGVSPKNAKKSDPS